MTVAVVDRHNWLGPADGVLDKQRVIQELLKYHYHRYQDNCVSNWPEQGMEEAESQPPGQ